MVSQKRMWMIISATLIVGALMGLVIAANFNWTPMGVAGSPAKAVLGSTAPPVEDTFNSLATGKAFVDVAKRVTPTVVSITSAKMVRVHNPLSDFFHENLWGRGRPDKDRKERQQGLGSGVIISPDGYILTNNHVIQEAEEISVLLDKKEYAAKLVGTDPKTDVAVIKIDSKNLPVIALGNSDNVDVGEWVLAIGNPFSLELAHTVTAGIVSGNGRAQVNIGDIEYEDFIQTDAAINPGNSGGALVNLRGELVGINTAIVTGGFGGGSVGVGFAIPINMARQVMQSLIDEGRVIRGYLGVNIQSVDEHLAKAFGLSDISGAVITNVMDESPAGRAGLKVEDIVVEFDGIKIRDHNHLMHLVASYKPGRRVAMTVWRNNRQFKADIVLGERPDEEPTKLASGPQDESKLGLQVATLTPELIKEYGLQRDDSGVVITGVDDGSQAERANLSEGSVIREVNRQPVETSAEYRQAVAATRGDVVLLRVMDNRTRRNFFVALRKEN